MNDKQIAVETAPTADRTNIRHWHSSHNDWLRALKFYKEEIDILDNRLTEIAGKNTGAEIAPLIEHFQNQFILHRNNIDELKHAIGVNIDRIAAETKTNDGFVSAALLDQMKHQEQRFQAEEDAVNQLRKEYNSFCTVWI